MMGTSVRGPMSPIDSGSEAIFCRNNWRSGSASDAMRPDNEPVPEPCEAALATR